MMISLTTFSYATAPYSALFRHLFEPALRSLALGALAAAALTAFRVKNPQTRLIVWTGVLYAALAMPFLALALPKFSVPLPPAIANFIIGVRAAVPSADASGSTPQSASPATVQAAESVKFMSQNETLVVETASRDFERGFPSAAPRKPSRIRGVEAPVKSIVSADSRSLSTSPALPSSATLAAPLQHSANSISWLALASIFYGFVAIALLARIALGAFLAQRLARSATTIADANAIRALLRQARRASLQSAPRLAESDLVSVPVTLGILRPAILLPAYWRDWDDATLAAVVAHEISHIARRDALTQRLSLAHRAIFWFSPLAWWLNRALIDAAEEASDEAALAAGADRAFYAKTLLGFFAALSENSGRVYWQGVPMAAPGQAERRLDRILNWKGAVGMRFKKSVALALAVTGIPVVLLAAAARPASRASSTPRPPQALQTPREPQASQVSQAPPVLAPPSALPALAALADAQAPQAPQAVQAAQAAPATPPVLAAPEPVPASIPGPAPAPAAPAIAPPAPFAPGTFIVPKMPKMSTEQFRIQLKNELDNDVHLGILNALDLQTLDGIHKQMTFSVRAMPQLSKEDAKQLKDLRQQLDDLKKQDDANHPDVLKLQKQIAELEQNMKLQMEPFKVMTPLNGQEKVFVFRGPGDGDRFVIVSNNSPIIMSGDSQDVEHATALRSKINGDFIWFQRDEKSYIIRDQNLVNQARAFFKPEQDLGDQQAALGKQQSDLGDQMRAMGDKMRDTKVTVPDMSSQMQKLMDEMKQLSASGGTPQQLGDLQRQLGDLQRQIGQAESQAMEPQRQAGSQMRDLGEKQRELGSQQRDLGQKQREASAQAHQQLKQLLDDAVTKGAAQPE